MIELETRITSPRLIQEKYGTFEKRYKMALQDG